MTFDQLKSRYGEHLAEILRQSMTDFDMNKITFCGLITHFESEAASSHKEYRRRLDNPPALNWPGEELSDYLNTLRHRWKHAEEIIRLLGEAEAMASGNDSAPLCA